MRPHGGVLPILLLIARAAIAAGVLEDLPHSVSDPSLRALIERDWVEQETARYRPGGVQDVSTQEDAAGGVDGVINGEYGFHCASGAKDSWWQVDLGRSYDLDRIVVYNRCGPTAHRAAQGLVILVSTDGVSWKEIYKHDGRVFYGYTDKKPLLVSLRGKDVVARFVRLQLRQAKSFHLDEVQVFARENPDQNIALGKPANQSSISQYSKRKPKSAQSPDPDVFTFEAVSAVIAEGKRLSERIENPRARAVLRDLENRLKTFPRGRPSSPSAMRELYMAARWAVRSIALSDPLLKFDRLLFVKRFPGQLAHMCDQYYGSMARPGGGLFILENIKGDCRVRDVLGGRLPPGSFLSPDLSYDGREILFAYCRATGDPKRRSTWTRDVCYHIFKVNVDGSDLKQLTDGPYDDFDPRFLPDGGIVFLSTRRGGYCRCGGRPVPTYTLHRMDPDGNNIRTLSCHETNEWNPSVMNDGGLIYTRWDYVDRNTNLAHSLWTARPDGSNAMAFYGNYNFAKKPWGLWHPRAIPNSHKVLAVAGAHHGYAEGSLVLIDPIRGQDGLEPLTRVTPETPFPEAEGWPKSNYTTPWPLSEDVYLAAYSPRWSSKQPTNLPPGIYLVDRCGHCELLYRDPTIPSESPIPLCPRPRPAAVASGAEWEAPKTGRFLLLNVYRSTEPMAAGSVKKLRVVQILPKTTFLADHPRISAARQISARYLLGKVPVEADGSAYFTAPAGVPLYFQAVDAEDMAYQSMRSITYVQPGQTLVCSGCHEPRQTAPSNRTPLAALRPPSVIEPGPEGTKPLSYLRLVQPVLDKHCVQCHSGLTPKKGVRLTGAIEGGEYCESYRTLATRSLVHWFDSIRGGEWKPRTYPGQFGARASKLVQMLRKGHNEVKLTQEELARICIWIDLNIPFYGVYLPEQVAAQRRGEAVPLDAILK